MAKVLGVDYGEKRIGLALAESGLAVAVPYGIVENRGEKSFEDIARVIREEDIEKIVIGLPTNLSGADTAQTQSTRVFADALRQRFGLPVVFEDERLTSKSADDLLRGHAKGVPKDAVAAALLLQIHMERS